MSWLCPIRSSVTLPAFLETRCFSRPRACSPIFRRRCVIVLPVFLTQTLKANGSIVVLANGFAQATQNIVQGFSGALRRALVQSAWAVSHKSNCFLTAQFYRRAARLGEKKAIVATAHQLLVIAFYILRDGTVYREKGGNYFDQLNPERTKRKLMARQERMGFTVTLRNSTPNPVPSPPAPPPSARRRGRTCKCVERGIDCKHGQ